MIAGAVILHLGIALVAPGLTEFGLAMIAANLAFVSGAWLRSLVTGAISRPCGFSSTVPARAAGRRWRC